MVHDDHCGWGGRDLLDGVRPGDIPLRFIVLPDVAELHRGVAVWDPDLVVPRLSKVALRNAVGDTAVVEVYKLDAHEMALQPYVYF